MIILAIFIGSYSSIIIPAEGLAFLISAIKEILLLLILFLNLFFKNL